MCIRDSGISRINVKLRSNEESEINGQGPVITEDNIKKLYEKLDCLKESDAVSYTHLVKS